MLKRRVTESHRFGIPLSVMHLKIEEYDIISQKYGSAIARQMVDVAEPALEKALREMDVLAKLENGEFVVMLPGNTQAEAGQVAEANADRNSAIASLPLVDRELQIALSARHRRAQAATKRRKNCWPGPGRAVGRWRRLRPPTPISGWPTSYSHRRRRVVCFARDHV